MSQTPDQTADPSDDLPAGATKPKPDATGIERVPQAHGGALLRSGVKGNRGGVSPARLKARCRNEFALLIPKVKKLTRTKDVKPAVLIRAAELFARFGMDDAIAVTDIRAALLKTKDELYDVLPAEQADMLWQRIASHWVTI